MTMNTILTLVVVSVLLSGIFAAGFSSSDAYAKEGNNGSNGCENSQGKGNGNGNAQACMKNTNASSNVDCTEEMHWLDSDGDGLGAGSPQSVCPGMLGSEWVTNDDDLCPNFSDVTNECVGA